jgi:excisionase family DNA binding protein
MFPDNALATPLRHEFWRRTTLDGKEPESEAIEPLMLRVNEAAKALRISEWLLYTRYIHTNKLPIVKSGRRTLVPVAALRALAERLQAEGAL